MDVDPDDLASSKHRRRLSPRIYVPIESRLVGKARWWSLARHEDEQALGLRHVRRKVAFVGRAMGQGARRAEGSAQHRRFGSARRFHCGKALAEHRPHIRRS